MTRQFGARNKPPTLPGESGATPVIFSEASQVGSDQAIIVDWLTRLQLLHGIPLHYLVPHEKLLPNESLRVFVVDLTWMQALTDGSLSVGRSVGLRSDKVCAFLRQGLAEPRCQKFREAGMRPREPSTTNPNFDRLSGFLLRSAIATAWPGLQIEGHCDPSESNGQSTRLRLLRLDFVAPGTLLGLFGGELKRLTLRQPAEALHWGVELQGEKFIKPRRDRGTGRTSSGFVEVPLRNDRRVLNVAELAARLDPEESPEKVRSPAWFALAMTQGGSSVTYTFNWRK